MEVIEIRNNLVKLEFGNEEKLILGGFVTLTSNGSSFVAQIINLKNDGIMQIAVAKLLFTFTQEGVVNEYDGSIPDINSQVSILKSEELLDLLSIETPIEMGNLAQQDAVLKLDISLFENNFTVFSDHDYEKRAFIYNCISQLSKIGEKTVVFDVDNIFDDLPRFIAGEDFKIPFDSKIIDYIYDNELSDMNIQTKSVIKDIFYNVQLYIDSLSEKFLPIDKFVDVIDSQYRQMFMPELAILKNKLLKYKDMGIFANTIEEFKSFSYVLNNNSTIIVDISELNSKLQNKVINNILSTINLLEGYVYVFLPVNNENSDKQLLRKIINNSHVFTTIFARHSYKYALELKEHAQNIAFFAPQTVQHEFAVYNTFLNKLNSEEFVICGKLTQNVPFMVNCVAEISDEFNVAKLDLNQNLTKNNNENDNYEITEPSNIEEEDFGLKITEINEGEEENTISEPLEMYHSTVSPEAVKIINDEITESQSEENNSHIIEPLDNILADDSDEVENSEEIVDEIFDDTIQIDDSEPEVANDILSDEDLDYIDENINVEDDIVENTSDYEPETDIISEDFSQEDDENVQMVPIYPAEDVQSGQADNADAPYSVGDIISHPRYGNGTVEKIIKYGNKVLCSVLFDNVGRRLLDPSISDFEKI